MMQHIYMDVQTVAKATPTNGSGGMPVPLIDIAKYWCNLANGQAPRWGEFKMMALGEATPYVTILHKMDDDRFAFEFCGSAVSTLIGQDLTSETVTADDGTLAEINWADRLNPVLADGHGHLQSGIADQQYTAPIDFLALDLPLRNPDDNEIGYVVGCTVSAVN